MAQYGAADLANGFRTVRKNTVQVAEDIPEDKYNFVAAPGMHTVSEMLRHIAFAPATYEDMHREKRVTTVKGYDFAAAFGRSASLEKQPRSKAEIVSLLKAEGERFSAWLESLSPEFLHETYTDHAGQNPKTRLESLMSPKEHEMHHRGQLMLIQRMLGIVPHLTRQREERARQQQAPQPHAATANAAPAAVG